MPLEVFVSTAAENELVNWRELDAADTILVGYKHHSNVLPIIIIRRRNIFVKHHKVISLEKLAAVGCVC